MKILWLGGVFSPQTVAENLAVSEACNSWSSGLLHGLQLAGHEICAIGHMPEPYWPRGKLRPDKRAQFLEKLPSCLVTYWNLYGFRQYSLKMNYLRIARRLLVKWLPDVVLSYNAYPWNNAVGLLALRNNKIPWIPIILDSEDPGDSWKEFPQVLREASGLVFLSYWGYEHCPFGPPKYRMGGGYESWRGNGASKRAYSHEDRKVVLYAGSLNESHGVTLMAEALRRVKTTNVEFHICGKGGHPSIDRLIASDSRANYLGFVTLPELERQHYIADVFLSLCPPSVNGNHMNFPSKLVKYLAFGKPVVSNRSPGLGPEYSRFLQVPKENSAESIAMKIDEVLSWTSEQWQEYSNNARAWFDKTRTWEVQSRRLADWVIDICQIRID